MVFFLIKIFIFLEILFVFWNLSLILSYYKGAPFSRSKKERIDTMLKLAEIKPGKVIVDLGSGDGVLIREAAKRGAKAIGVEINPFLVLYSKLKIFQQGLNKNCKVIWGDLFHYPLDKANVVFIYLFPKTVEKLKEKFIKELKPGAFIISNGFPIPEWKIEKKENKVFLYKIEEV